MLAIRPAEARIGPYLTGMIGLSMGLGFGGIMGLLSALFSLFGMGPGPDPVRLYVASFGGAIAFALAMSFWHHRRRRLRRLSKDKRILWAALTWCLSAAYVVYFAMTVVL